MKKVSHLLLMCLILLAGIFTFSGLFSRIETVSAEINNKQFVNFVLTGGQGYYPYNYFDELQQATDADNILYYNRDGEKTDVYRAIKDSVDFFPEQYSTGQVSVALIGDMLKLAQTGHFYVYASAGLLALKDKENSKIIISISADDQTVSTTSDLVHSGGDFNPDWVETEKINLTPDTQSVEFSFTNRETSSFWDRADFYIFEPMISFGLNIDEITLNMTNSIVVQGELLELKAETFLSQIQGDSEFLEYYKTYHQIEWEVIKGSSLSYISGSYLKVTGNSGIIKVRAKCHSSTDSDEYIYSDIITLNIDSSIHRLDLTANFPDGADLFGGGDYLINETETVIFAHIKPGHSFMKIVDEEGNDIPYTIVNGDYRAVIDMGTSRQIEFILIKDIQITSIEIEDKYYDRNDIAYIDEIIIDGILPNHNIVVNDTLSGRYSSILPASNIYINLEGEVSLSGADINFYNFNSSIPATYGNILKRDIFVTANYVEKEYGDSDPIITYSFEADLLSGDSLTGELSRQEGEILGEYEISQGTLDLPNYNIILTSNIFKIVARKINIANVRINDKVYDKTTTIDLSLIELTVVGTFINENAELRFEADFENVNVGTDIIVNFNAWIIGEESGCYELIMPTMTIKGDVIPKLITISAIQGVKTYGDRDPSLTFEYNEEELIAGDQFTGFITRSLGEDAGTYIISIGTLSALNYEINFVNADFIILKRVLEVVAQNKIKTYGEIDPALTYIISDGYVLEGEILGLTLKRASGESVGNYEILIDSQLNINYEIHYTPANFVINKRDAIINVSTLEKIYNGNNVGILSIEYENIILTDEVSLNIISLFESPNAGTSVVNYYHNNELISEFNSSLITGNNSDYNFIFNVSRNSKIHKKEISVIVQSDNYKKYGDEDKYNYLINGIVEGEVLNGELERITGENVGSYTINQGTLTNENNPNYIIEFECNGIFIILKRDVKIIIDNLEIFYGEDEGEIVYYLAGTTPLQSGVNLTDILTGSPTRESGFDNGVYKYLVGSLMLKQEIKNNYNFIFQAGSLTIKKIIVDININNCTKSYGEDDPVIVYQINVGSFVNLNDLTITREEGENVGDYLITATATKNYNMTFTHSNLTIIPTQLTIKANDLLKTYGNLDPTLSFTITSGILMFEDTVSSIFLGNIEREEGEQAGTYIISQGSLTSTPNYFINFQSGALLIQKKNLLIKANAVIKFLDEETQPELTYIAEGIVEEDGFSVELFVDAPNELGEYDIQISTLDSRNYNITFVSAKYSIVKRALYVNIDYVAKEYDGTSEANLTYSISGDIEVGDEDLLGITITKEEGYLVGKYLITATSSNDKYEIVVDENHFEILPRKITIKADDIEITYGEAVPDQSLWTYTIEGQVIDNELNINLYRTQNYCAGTFKILGTITNTNNYDITFIPGQLIINKKTINVYVNNYEKIYGQSDPYLSYSLDQNSLHNGDILLGAITREVGNNAGGYNLICSLVNENYNFVMNKAKLTIKPKELILVTSTLDKIYDETDVAYLRMPTLSGIFNNDDVYLDYKLNELARFEDAEVGDDKLVIVYGGKLAGKMAQNYYVTRPVGLTASIANSVVKDGSVSVFTSPSNTKLKIGTALQTTQTQVEENNFGETKLVLGSYSLALSYNDEEFENYGLVNVAIELERDYLNVQLFSVDENGDMQILKSRFKDGKVIFETDQLGTYVVVVDDDHWVDYAIIVALICFSFLLATIFLTKIYKIKKDRKI
ncbi:MAG: MBG domain-containing protein [Clostridia bacterium]|nr:MBG domain-containing protein [Clostridia bacterium]